MLSIPSPAIICVTLSAINKTHIAKRVAQNSEHIQPLAMWNQRALLYLHKWIIPHPAKPANLLPHSLAGLLASKQNSVETTPELSETVPSPDCEEFEPAFKKTSTSCNSRGSKRRKQNLHYNNVNAALIVYTSRRPAETNSGKGYVRSACESLCSAELVPQVTARRVQVYFGAP